MQRRQCRFIISLPNKVSGVCFLTTMSTESSANTPSLPQQPQSPSQGQPQGQPQFQPQTQPVPQPFDPRRRLRELLSIPDRDRSDAEWDELNELEIQMAPGNRVVSGPGSSGGPSNNMGGGTTRYFGPKKPKGDKGGNKNGKGRRPPPHVNKPQQG